ncbi:hypothetical protein CBS101457_003819 [Exobasidium rhododendri]|nr:hypothetical protein CBS101457_001249 [Exobasidium rhododendri]UZJ52820.1 hypothetical protein CBS101457_002140 [Exobasidium rhododendri]UZJ52841.1 hypothetical protein CBS101457_002161 [Exobasidium rhododendri]UZJ53465.1 hypothetical protein CBS101457_002785 [Exobasidium rhododendri]UZJ54499.1 hypothetical protein CBS101457_003819 [Exobasidium rhododendri]
MSNHRGRITRAAEHFLAEANLQLGMVIDMEDDVAPSSTKETVGNIESAEINNTTEAMPNAEIADEWDDAFGDQYVQDHLLSSGTIKSYKQNIVRFRKWIATLGSSCTFKDGLDMLGEHSERLCRAWLQERVRLADANSSTLQSMHAALKWHFLTVHNCDSAPQTGWHKTTEGEWTGNPVFSKRYLNLFRSKMREVKRSLVASKSSLPMLYQYLSVILKDIKTKLLAFDATPHLITSERTQLEFMHFYMILAYRLWARCDEICSMLWRHIHSTIKFSSPGNNPYLEVTIAFRKTNQYELNKANVYQLYFLPGRPLVDAVSSYQRWHAYWKLVCGHEPRPTDHIFPAPDKKVGRLQTGTRMEAAQINLMLGQIENINSMLKNQQGKFTSHCFRRGGAQDAVLHAHLYGEQRQSITRALWWGGWSKGERTNMLAHYLLEEVATQEEYHGDMEDPGGDNVRGSYFAGAQMSGQDRMIESFQYALGKLEKQLSIMQQTNVSLVEALLQGSQRVQAQAGTANTAATPSVVNSVNSQLEHLAGTSAAVAIGANAASALASGTPHIAPGRPLPLRIPSVKTVEEVVKQWELGNASQNLLALCRWTPAMRKKDKGGNAQVYSLRKKIYDGYLKRNKDLKAFYEAYGGPGLTLRRYIDAIKAEEKDIRVVQKG